MTLHDEEIIMLGANYLPRALKYYFVYEKMHYWTSNWREHDKRLRAVLFRCRVEIEYVSDYLECEVKI